MTDPNVLFKYVFAAASAAAAAAATAANALPPAPLVVGTDSHVVARHDDRVSLTLTESRYNFRDVTIDNHRYTVYAHQGLQVKAPIGTQIVAADNQSHVRGKGTVLVEIAAAQNNGRVRID